MNLKILLSAYAVFATASGAALLLIPSTIFSSSMYGLPPLDDLETSLARSVGAAFVGLGVMCWAARTAEVSKARDALMLGLMVANGLGAVVSAMSAGGNWVIWAEAGFLALVAVLFIVIGRQGKVILSKT